MPTPFTEPILLRPAIHTDEPLIRALIRRNGLNPLGINWQRFTLATRGPDGPVIGMGQMKVHADGSRELASIAVVEEARERGIARQIIEHLLAAETGVVWLTCRPPMRGFYEPFGFIEILDPSGMPRYFGRIARVLKWLRRVGMDRGPAIMRRDPP